VGFLFGKLYGLPDTSVKEAKERVKTAIKNSGIDFQSKRIVVNLAPAATKKEGSSYDLPIAVGILTSTEVIENKNMGDIAFIGELSLDGKVNRINGILPMCIEAKRLGMKKIILPAESSKEAGIVKGIQIIPVNHLKQVIDYLNGAEKIEQVSINIDEIFKTNSMYKVDFSEVKGQENIKRALEVAAAGGHNCLLIGSPGSRKNHAGKKATFHITRFKF